MSTQVPTARLLIACPDAPGIVAAVTSFIAEQGGNLLHAEQHTDREHNEFCMRAWFEITPSALESDRFREAMKSLADRFSMQHRLRRDDDRRTMVVMASRSSHCLLDLLWRWQSGELDVDLPLVISNHPHHKALVESMGIRYLHLPVTRETKAEQEAAVKTLLEQVGADLVVLARYMQILSPTFIEGWDGRIINIHHSFLPAFVGSDPYRQAYDRGVKIIGATSHYVTADLDQGPIIAQAVTEVSHNDSVAELRRRGSDLERVVLARAVRAHVEDKILIRGNKTIVFR